MNYLRRYLRTALIALVIFIAIFWVNGSTSDQATQARTNFETAKSAGQSLHAMIGRDLEDYGQVAPKRARVEENRRLNLENAHTELVNRVLFRVPSDFDASDIADDDLLAFYDSKIREMETIVRKTFWKPRALDARTSGKSEVGINFGLIENFGRLDFETRLWQLDTLRRVFELSEYYRIAEVSKFEFETAASEEVFAMAPASIDVMEDLRQRRDETTKNFVDPYSTQVEDPFTLVYQTLKFTFAAGLAEAINFIDDLARERGGSSIGRSLFPLRWKLTHDPADSTGTGRVIVEVRVLAMREIRGSNLTLASLKKVMPEVFLEPLSTGRD